ncbi:hypothetical protein K501DRAFT_226936 [Backusella circina FSU 941]|nr:hypothetical protein K501DRAFT_226936 [Backusella circina FSU 941]
MSTKREQIIKGELANYKPTEDEKLVIKSALFNLISLSTIGAASLGVSANLFAKSRGKGTRTAIPTILGTFTGLAFGGIMGMDKGMHKLRESLPTDSRLLAIIRENDKLKAEENTEIISRALLSDDDNEKQ